MSNNILRHVRLRKSLGTVSAIIAGCETRSEAIGFLAGLGAEISKLVSGVTDSPCYIQAASALDGHQSYGLDRIGFWPASADKPSPSPELQQEITRLVGQLRDLGCAVCTFSPEELGQSGVKSVEDAMRERGDVEIDNTN